MKDLNDTMEADDLTRLHPRRRRRLLVLLRTAKVVSLILLALCLGGYWFLALSRPMEREPVPVPVAAAATLAVIQTAQDGGERRIHSVRFQGTDVHHRVDYLAAGRRREYLDIPRHFANVTFNAVPNSLFVPHYPARTLFWSQGDETHPSVPVPRPAGL